MGNRKIFGAEILEFDPAPTIRKLDKNADDAVRAFRKGKISL